MRNQYIIGVAFFLLGVILLWYFSGYGFGSFPFYIGQAFLTTIIATIIGRLVLATIKYGQVVSVFMVIGTAWLGSTVYLSVELYQNGLKERETGQAAVALLNSLAQGNVISQPADNTNTESVEYWLKDYIQRQQINYSHFFNEVKSSGFATMLYPDNLAQTSTARESLRRITILIQSVGLYEEKIIAEVHLAEQRIANRSDSASRSAYLGLQKSKQHGIDGTKKFFEIERAILMAARDVIVLSIQLEGRIHAQEGRLVFEDDEQLDKYKKLISKISRLAEQEAEFKAEQIRHMNQFSDALAASLR